MIDALHMSFRFDEIAKINLCDHRNIQKVLAELSLGRISIAGNNPSFYSGLKSADRVDTVRIATIQSFSGSLNTIPEPTRAPWGISGPRLHGPMGPWAHGSCAL